MHACLRAHLWRLKWQFLFLEGSCLAVPVQFPRPEPDTCACVRKWMRHCFILNFGWPLLMLLCDLQGFHQLTHNTLNPKNIFNNTDEDVTLAYKHLYYVVKEIICYFERAQLWSSLDITDGGRLVMVWKVDFLASECLSMQSFLLPSFFNQISCRVCIVTCVSEVERAGGRN